MNSNIIVNVSSRDVFCDGGDGGHPRIFLKISESEQIACPYCGKVFVLDENTED